MEEAVPLAVSVIVSPDPAEIDLHMTLDPLAVDPLLIQNENVKIEVKQEGIPDEKDTEMKEEDPLGDVPNISIVLSALPSIPKISKAETSRNPFQDKDPLRDVPNTSVVPSSILASLLSIHKVKKTEDASKDRELETMHIKDYENKSSERSSLQRIVPRNNENVETAIFEESANGASNTGRATRRSATLALAPIHQSKLSNGDADSDGSKSYIEDSDEWEEESSKKHVSVKQNCKQQKGKIGKDADHTKAPWCSCEQHSCSTLDKIDYELGSYIVCKLNTVHTLQDQQKSLNTFTNKKNASLESLVLQDNFIASKTLANISKNVMAHRQEQRKQTCDVLDVGSNTNFIINGSKEPQLKNSLLLIKNNSVQDNNSKLPPESKEIQESNQTLPVLSESNKTSEDNVSTSSLIDTQLSRIPVSSNICFEVCENAFTKSLRNLPELKTSQGSYTDVNQNPKQQYSGDCVNQSPRKWNPDCQIKKMNEKFVSCSICGVQVPKGKLKLHLVKHSDDRPIKCELCPKTFKTNSCLKSHTDNVHSNKIHECYVCEKQYKSKHRLRLHISTLHNGKSYTRQCAVCSKIIQREGMKRHMLVHSAEYSLSCNICDKKFPNDLRLKNHIRYIHEITTPRHICDVCGAKLGSLLKLKDHANIHLGTKPHVCEVCGKGFAVQSGLTNHKHIHQEKKYKCDMCGFACNRMDNLGTHIRSHTGEKPYKCIICSKTFTRCDNLTTHKRLVHKVK